MTHHMLIDSMSIDYYQIVVCIKLSWSNDDAFPFN